MLITIGEAVAYVVSGMYGDVRDLGAWSAILIILQVSFIYMRMISISITAAELSVLLSHIDQADRQLTSCFSSTKATSSVDAARTRQCCLSSCTCGILETFAVTIQCCCSSSSPASL